MPVVEAMACGTPVVAAQSSSIPEAGGEAALYFNPDNVDALTNCLSAVLDDATLATTMRLKGLAQARLFSWARAGQETARVYGRALAQ
jgi:glycosyltransferase involved in cell wall biosynthesis